MSDKLQVLPVITNAYLPVKGQFETQWQMLRTSPCLLNRVGTYCNILATI